jgi:Fe-S-cluster containining protein
MSASAPGAPAEGARSREELQAGLRALHAAADRAAARLAERHRARLRCRRGCAACCIDGLTVYEIEAERIRLAHGDLLARGEAHAPGACAFLGPEGECRIYADRPYVCRTQGLPLRWLEEEAGGEITERRDICPLNAEGPPLQALAEDDCFTIGPFEDRLAALEHALDGGAGRRVALRSLFRRGA